MFLCAKRRAATSCLFFRRHPAFARRIALRNFCLCNGFTLYTSQRIVGMSSKTRPAFPSPLDTTKSGVRCNNKGRFYVRQARQVPPQKCRVMSFFRGVGNVGLTLSSQTRRELIQQIVSRHREASASQKGALLEEIAATTGYARCGCSTIRRRDGTLLNADANGCTDQKSNTRCSWHGMQQTASAPSGSSPFSLS